MNSNEEEVAIIEGTINGEANEMVAVEAMCEMLVEEMILGMVLQGEEIVTLSMIETLDAAAAMTWTLDEILEITRPHANEETIMNQIDKTLVRAELALAALMVKLSRKSSPKEGSGGDNMA
jgi:hypothetical protein